MTMHTLIMMILWGFTFLLLAGLFLTVFIIGRRSVRDNITKAIIFKRVGNRIRKLKGDLMEKPSSSGCRYKYGNDTIFVPKKYSEDFFECRRIIFINNLGQLVASPFGDDKPLSKTERSDLIYELFENKIGFDVIKAIKGNAKVGLLLVAIIAFVVGALAVSAYTQMSKTTKQMPSPATQEIAPEETSQGSIKIEPVGGE